MTATSILPRIVSGPPAPAVWRRLFRPVHYRGVHQFRLAAEQRDSVRLEALLHPDVTVAVASDDREHPTVRVVRGRYDAVALLLHGITNAPRSALAERSINGQAGLTLSQNGAVAAAMVIDFTSGMISGIWVQLRPEMLRNWNSV
jgi:hypothetical protein